jgi:1-aminocyclopropane-1-carboxylate deaminase/D-cysteine desulfhydrase-like pyridoxal-dependent ACC family enzyme
VEEVTNGVKEEGYNPYIAPIGGSMAGCSMEKPLGAIAYVEAFVEILEQGEALGIEANAILFATGSGGTQAGLVAGAKVLKENVKIVGISVSEEKGPFGRDVLNIASDTVKALDLNFFIYPEDIVILDEYIKEGYGIVTEEVTRAIRTVAANEGIFLDPIYTGKAMVALFDLVKKEYFKKGDKVIFLHTGGTPALFPHKHLLVDFLK